ncbi:MAG: hypothetical protein ACXWM7_04580 [Parachlamydiaceae bacterium]
MSYVSSIRQFSEHLDQVILEKCEESEVRSIIANYLPNLAVAEMALRKSIELRMRSEFESDLAKKTFQSVPADVKGFLEEEYCGDKPIIAASDAIDTFKKSIKASETHSTIRETKKTAKIARFLKLGK